MLTHHQALIYTMVLMSAADESMPDYELGRIDQMVSALPVFHDYDVERLPSDATECAGFFNMENGLENVMAEIKLALPEQLRETAYALACDVAAVDGVAADEEVRLLQVIRQELEIDRLIATGIERGARARHMKF